MAKQETTPIIMYTTADGQTKIAVSIDPTLETVWLTQAHMAELFQTTVPNVSMHIKNVYEEGELEKMATVKDFLIVQKEGARDVSRKIEHYNLDVIISVGYRVKSLRGTQFRIWATQILHEYMQKGFAMNDELLKQAGGGNYFKELLERLRDIRSSEKVFYRQVLELFATSIDYDAKSETAVEFFKVMQNKLLWATSGKTATELIFHRADAERPFMGLSVFKGSKPTKAEVTVAKNYLTEDEIFVLNHLVNAYFDIAELRAREHEPMYMKDWLSELDAFIKLNRKDILTHAGHITHLEAETKALQEYDKYKEKTSVELTQVERDFLDTIHKAYELLEKKPVQK